MDVSAKLNDIQRTLTVVTCCEEFHISLGRIDLFAIVNDLLESIDYLLVLDVLALVERNAFSIIANTIFCACREKQRL